jgi:DNA topoisomerase VI subunit B
VFVNNTSTESMEFVPNVLKNQPTMAQLVSAFLVFSWSTTHASIVEITQSTIKSRKSAIATRDFLATTLIVNPATTLAIPAAVPRILNV